MKNHSQEILQEAAGDLQEEAESYSWMFEGGKMMGKGKWRLDEGVEVSRTCQGRLRKSMMVGFVQMARGQLMQKHKN